MAGTDIVREIAATSRNEKSQLKFLNIFTSPQNMTRAN